MDLTGRQRDVLAYLKSFQSERGFPPTVREMMLHFGINSPNGMVCHLKALEAKGAIRRDKNSSRGIHILGGPPFEVVEKPCVVIVKVSQPLTPEQAGELGKRLVIFWASRQVMARAPQPEANHVP